MKQKCSSDVKGSLWNHLDKKVFPSWSTFIFKSVPRKLVFKCWFAYLINWENITLFGNFTLGSFTRSSVICIFFNTDYKILCCIISPLEKWLKLSQMSWQHTLFLINICVPCAKKKFWSLNRTIKKTLKSRLYLKFIFALQTKPR